MGYIVQDHPCLNTTYGRNVCPFRWINGGILTVSSIGGVILNLFVMFIILIAKVKLPGHQNIFMFNLAISNLILSLLGTFRGLGILFPIFVIEGDNNRQNELCGAYAIALNTLGQCNTVSLVPLTLERFAAIVFPFHHRYLFTGRKCTLLALLMWSIKLIYMAVYVNLYLNSTVQTKFYFNYHRCTTSGAENLFFVRYILFTFVPFFLVIVMYSIMIWRVRVEKLNSRRMLLVTFLVIFTGMVAWFPSIIANFGNINMNYEISQIFTVTLFYLNSVSDPIIYILGYPSVKNYLRGLTRRRDRHSVPHLNSSVPALADRSHTDLRTVEVERELSTVLPPSELRTRPLRGSYNCSTRHSVVSRCEPPDKYRNSVKKSLKRSLTTTFTQSIRGSKGSKEPKNSPKVRRYTVCSQASSYRSSLRNAENTYNGGVSNSSTSVNKLPVSPDDVIQLDCLKDCTVVQNSTDEFLPKRDK